MVQLWGLVWFLAFPLPSWRVAMTKTVSSPKLWPSAQAEHPWTTAVAPWEKRPVAPVANWSASSKTNWYKEILKTFQASPAVRICKLFNPVCWHSIYSCHQKIHKTVCYSTCLWYSCSPPPPPRPLNPPPAPPPKFQVSDISMIVRSDDFP